MCRKSNWVNRGCRRVRRIRRTAAGATFESFDMPGRDNVGGLAVAAINAIELEGLGKRYMLGERVAYQTAREALARTLRRGQGAGDAGSELWAIRDIDLSIGEGEVVGVIGRNGAGKTTLLKVISRITEPTTGVARIRGRVGSLLEVGTGFHPELTGHENIFLNGAVLGMSRREITAKFDEIVEFSGVERFLETPLKRYSSGMQLRLAFAVAAHLEPEIVVVDEVLAVGDAEFQRKCLGKMSDLRGEGRTVMFVSHDLGAIAALCRRVIWLERGAIKADGPAHAVLDEYLRFGIPAQTRVDLPSDATQPAELVSVELVGNDTAARVRRDEPFRVRLRFRAREPAFGLDIGIYLVNREGVRILDDVWSDWRQSEWLADEPGEYEATVEVPPVLASGEYVLGVWFGTAVEDLFDQELMSFEVVPRPDDRKEWIERARVMQPELRWTVRGEPPEAR
jgi:ABC-type polysaccharide/polyol phosphate transport system ATPase subunit